MVEEYAWMLWFILPLTPPVMGLLFLAACALADRETSLPAAAGLGSATFLASAALGLWLVPLLGSQDAQPGIAFGSMHILGIGAALVGSWLIGSFTYAAAFKGQVPKGMQVAAIEVLLRLLFGALIGAGLAVIYAAIQVGRDPRGRDLLLWGGLIFAGVLAVIVTLVIVTGILRRRAR